MLGAAAGGLIVQHKTRYRLLTACATAVCGTAVHLLLARELSVSWYTDRGLVKQAVFLVPTLTLLYAPVWWSVRFRSPAPGDAEAGHDGTSAPRAADVDAELASLLHDTVGQGLAVIAMQTRNTTHAEHQLHTIDEVATHTMTELRSIIGQLHRRSRAAESPGEYLVDVVNRFFRIGLAVEFVSHGTDEELPPLIRAVIVRIASEALANSLKHAPGAMVLVKLDVGTETTLMVRTRYPSRHCGDTAGALGTVGSAWTGGDGSRMMQRLAAQCGGYLRIDSNRRAFTVLATFPANRQKGGPAVYAGIGEPARRPARQA